MNKMLCVAWREFAATVLTKGFIIGILVTPLMLLVVIGAVVLMKNMAGPRAVGTVAVIDRTGLVGQKVSERFSEEAVAKEAEVKAEQVTEKLAESELGQAAMAAGGDQAATQMKTAIKESVHAGPQLIVEVLDAAADVEKEKEPVRAAQIKVRRTEGQSPQANRLALIVIPTEAVTGGPDGKFATFEAYFAKNLDFQVQSNVNDRVADAVVDARLEADPGIKQAGLSNQRLRDLFGRPKAESKMLTPEGEKDSSGPWGMFIAMGFMMLMMIAVMTSGQTLLTTLVEEKSSRVMEVLLSAVSPMQLMTGKIVGQMCVGLIILLMYGSIGIAGLVIAAQQHLINPSMLIFVVIFFLIAYFLIASLMAGIGAAVNEMREAQNLMTPVMIIIMIPWMIWFVIQRAPNSTLATVLSFIPGPNPFVMVLRMSASEPVPTWQIPVGILVGILSVIVAAWAAAKVFRIGVLMYGKPPNIATLIRWVRMA